MSAARSWAAHLTPVVALGAVLVALWVARSPPAGLAALVLALLLVGLVVWIVVSVLWPSRADRACPACKEDSLERIDRDSTVGVRCRACGFEDPTRSGFYLAEEEGPLEPTVLSERDRRKRRPPMDTRHDPH